MFDLSLADCMTLTVDCYSQHTLMKTIRPLAGNENLAIKLLEVKRVIKCQLSPSEDLISASIACLFSLTFLNVVNIPQP